MKARFSVPLMAGLSLWIFAQAADSAPATQPATQPTTQPALVPEQVAGSWVEGSVSPTTFWDIKTGIFQGNARGMGQYLILNRDGTYKQYVYIETRMYNLVTQIWTQHEGTVSFTADTFTLRPTKGHYRAAGTHKINRPMTDKELAAKVTTYKWRIEKDAKGQEILVIPFDDGSSFRLRRAQ